MLVVKGKYSKKWYQKEWCEDHNVRGEVVVRDGTRCDCLTDTYAIEFYFSSNWAEAIG
jgi:hypothetical protein